MSCAGAFSANDKIMNSKREIGVVCVRVFVSLCRSQRMRECCANVSIFIFTIHYREPGCLVWLCNANKFVF